MSIHPDEIEGWFYKLPEADLDHPITPGTANNIFATLFKMMSEAHRLGHIRSNPCTGIELLGTNPRPRDILRLPEVDKLFNQSHAIDNLHGTLKTTKNNKIRTAPIPAHLRDHLREMAGHSEGYIFSEDGGMTPVGHSFFLGHFKYALLKIGITEQQRKERNVVFHGWRIFFNTVLQINGIAEVKVRAIIGHLDESMTAHYTNVPAEEYQSEQKKTIGELQERIMRTAV